MTTSLASRTRCAALLIVLPLLAGCSATASGQHASGSGSPSSASASASTSAPQSASSRSAQSVDLKPCDYLSAAEASTILGVKVKSSELGGACNYTGAQAVGFGTTVNGGLTGADDPVWKNEVASLSDATKISDVGDEAYGETGAVEVKLIVRAGGHVIEIADADGSGTTTFPHSVAIAKAIIAKLG